MPPKAQGFGKMAKQTFKRFFRMKVSNNAGAQTKKNTNTTAHAMETNINPKTVFNTSHQDTGPSNNFPAQRTNSFNAQPQMLYLLGKYQFVFSKTDTTYSVVINEVDREKHVTTENINPRTMESPSKIINTGFFNEIKNRLITNTDTNTNTITCTNEQFNNYKIMINLINKVEQKHSSATNLSRQVPEIKPASAQPTQKKGRLISRATKRIKNARKVFVSGVRRAGRGAVRGAKWIGAQTKKKLTAFVSFFTTIFGKFDNSAERNNKPTNKPYNDDTLSLQTGISRQKKSSHHSGRNNMLETDALVNKIKRNHGPVDGSVTVENTVIIKLYNTFELSITQNNTGNYDYTFTIKKMQDNSQIQLEDFRKLVVAKVDNEDTEEDATYYNNIMLLAHELENFIAYNAELNNYKFNPDSSGSNINKFATNIREIGRLLDAYNESMQKTAL